MRGRSLPFPCLTVEPSPADSQNPAINPGPTALLTFLYYFTTTTLVMALPAAQLTHTSLSTPLPYRIGIPFGVLAGLAGAYYNASVVLEMTYPNSKRFQTELEGVLESMGFRPAGPAGPDQVYRPAALWVWLVGTIRVHFEANSATLIARAVHARQLRRQLGTYLP